MKREPTRISGFDDDQNAVAQLIRHLPTDSDMSLLVLKGHQLVEVRVREIIRAHAQDSDAVLGRDVNFSFRPLARIARAVSFTEGDAWIWDAVAELNKLRNEFAHELEPDSAVVDRCISNLVAVVRSARGDVVEIADPGVEAFNALSCAISVLLGSLMGIRK